MKQKLFLHIFRVFILENINTILEILDSEQILSNDQTPMYPASFGKVISNGYHLRSKLKIKCWNMMSQLSKIWS